MSLRMGKLPSLLCFILVILAVLDCGRGLDFCKEVVEPIGYGCTEFSVETDDGFVLVMHRLGRFQSLIGDEHINGTAQPHNVMNSGDIVIEEINQFSQGGDERGQCDDPNLVDLIPASRTVCSADSNGSRQASNSASSTLDLVHHLCLCACSCSDGNTTRTATCSELSSAQNARGP